MSGKRRCSKTTKAGKPCKGTPIAATDYETCVSHASGAVKAELGFGGSENGRKGAEAKRVPRLTELLRERVEARADEILNKLFSMLEAEKAVVVGNGPTAHVEVVADDDLALKAIREIYDRAEGRAKQATEITGAGGEPLHPPVQIPDDADYHRQVAEVLVEAEVIKLSAERNGSRNGHG